ncbi:MAG: ABC transporter permease [Muribaculaceae bacterium]|nr:ABC transporter permease [Muribaculaceae bacterium]
MKKLIRKLLYKNLSKAQLLGFILSNFVGLAIVILGLQFWEDARPIWEDEDSFIRKDYLVINKKVNGSNTLGAPTSFTQEQIEEIESQPWTRKVGRFTAADYRMSASLQKDGQGMSTAMFFEAIPDEFIDVAGRNWKFKPGDNTVPIIISKDYLSLYNFGFAGTVGMSQFSEETISSVPMIIRIRPDNGKPDVELQGYIVGFSNRLNTILVPQDFMDWSNAEFSTHDTAPAPSRLIIDVNSPGDVRIAEFMKEHDYEIAGDKANSTASYLVNVITGVALSVGALITLLSFFILVLSISLLMQKNRTKIHSLIMQGVELKVISGVYIRLVVMINFLAWAIASGAMFLFRDTYLGAIRGMGAREADPWLSLTAGLVLTLVMTALNAVFIRNRVRKAFLN